MRATDNNLRKKAKGMYEAGYSMFDIHQELKINMGTLYNLSSREGWIKGLKKKKLEIEKMEKEVSNITDLQYGLKMKHRQAIIDFYDDLKLLREDRIDDFEKKINLKLNINANIALASRGRALKDVWQQAKEVFDIKTEDEKIKTAIEKIRYEKLKILFDEDIENKKMDLKLKKQAYEMNVLEANKTVLELELKAGGQSIEENIQVVHDDIEKWSQEAWQDEADKVSE